MILHVTFRDGSNPWISFNANRHEIAKQWRRWMKYHPKSAWPVVHCGGWLLKKTLITYDGIKFEITPENGSEKPRYYKHLGHALAALERLGGVCA